MEKDVLTIENGVVKKCDKSAVSVVIPDGVTEIGDWAFKDCSALKSIVIPNGVTEIEWQAFKNCASLESVTFPEGITQIGGEAFMHCSSLKAIVLPNSLVTILEGAFDGCTSLSSVVFGDKITKIDKFAFSRCESLKSIEIPSSVREIECGAFADCSSLSSIVIPEGVTKLGREAFYQCTALTSIEIPSTMTKIEKDAFKGCEAVERIVSAAPQFPFNEKTQKLYSVTKTTKKAILSLGKDIAKQAKVDEVQKTSASAVLDSILAEHKAQVVVLRDEKSANLRIKASFGGIEILLADSKVTKWMKTLPALLDLASSGADAYALKKFADENALEDASRKYLTVSKTNSVSQKKKVEPVYIFIPEGVTEIGHSAFYISSTLEFVGIPSSVTKIEARAFELCKNLKSIIIPESVTEISRYAFTWSGVSEITFGGTVSQWDNLDVIYRNPTERVKCADGEWIKPVLVIKNGVVTACDKEAVNVVIPEGVTKIGKSAFHKLEEESPIKSIVIPSTVTEIGDCAFARCHNLESIVIPAGVTKIEAHAFFYCSKLTDFAFAGTVAQWNAIEKGYEWNCLSKIETVKCSDGDVAL